MAAASGVRCWVYAARACSLRKSRSARMPFVMFLLVEVDCCKLSSSSSSSYRPLFSRKLNSTRTSSSPEFIPWP